jgi:hypothetical protein
MLYYWRHFVDWKQSRRTRWIELGNRLATLGFLGLLIRLGSFTYSGPCGWHSHYGKKQKARNTRLDEEAQGILEGIGNGGVDDFEKKRRGKNQARNTRLDEETRWILESYRKWGPGGGQYFSRIEGYSKLEQAEITQPAYVDHLVERSPQHINDQTKVALAPLPRTATDDSKPMALTP